jgi:O-antigen/teichoic acid export membrane protein
VSAAGEARFRRDVIWNFAAFVIMGVSGVLMNMLIARMWNAATLGVINQVLTIHILVGQIAAFGIHLSVLKYVSQHAHDPAVVRVVVHAGALVLIPIAGIVVLVSWAIADPIGRLLESPPVRDGLIVILPAIALFAVNKLLANVLNGLRAMRLFAISQAARPVLYVVSTSVFGLLTIPAERLPWILTISEAILSIWLLTCTMIMMPRGHGYQCLREWVRIHLAFGWKAAFAGWIAEANTRIDILVLGIFASDRTVGIYAAASTIVEGLVQLPTVLRNNLNPLITQLASTGRIRSLQSMMNRAAKLAAFSMVACSALAIVGFPVFVGWILGDPIYLDAWIPFSIACAGLAIGAWMMPLDSFLIQVGLPGQQTAFKLFAFAVNGIALIVLVPTFGMLGAAVSAAIMFTASSLVLFVVVRRTMHRFAEASPKWHQ